LTGFLLNVNSRGRLYCLHDRCRSSKPRQPAALGTAGCRPTRLHIEAFPGCLLPLSYFLPCLSSSLPLFCPLPYALCPSRYALRAMRYSLSASGPHFSSNPFVCKKFKENGMWPAAIDDVDPLYATLNRFHGTLDLWNHPPLDRTILEHLLNSAQFD